MSIQDLSAPTDTYGQRKSSHQLQTIQPRVAAVFNKYRGKKINFIKEEDWLSEEHKNAEEFKNSSSTVTVVLDKDSQPIWQSHK
jgi:hypothetical protein